MSARPSVLFVCVKNGGKSQMAAALMRQRHGEAVDVYSAGTRPGGMLNAASVASLEEVGASVTGEHPKPIDPDLLARWTDLVPVVLVDGIEVAHWELDPRILRRALGRRRRLWPL